MKKFQQTREVIKYSSKYINGKTLDLGAGRVKYKSIISKFCDQYVAFDNVAGKDVNVVGDILNTSFADESFNTIICTMVFEHIPKPWLAVKEMKRILKKGGVVIVTAPFIQSYHQDPEDYYRYTVKGMETLFEDFKIIEADYYGEFFTTISGFIKMHFFNPYKAQDNKKIKSRIKNKIFRMIEKLAKFLDRFIKSDITYIASYIIAKK